MTSGDLHQKAFEAGQRWIVGGHRDASGVSNAAATKYGFSKWSNGLRPGTEREAGTTKARLFNSYKEGVKSGKRMEKKAYGERSGGQKGNPASAIITAKRIPINSQGYEKGPYGKYYGAGAPLYRWNYDNDETKTYEEGEMRSSAGVTAVRQKVQKMFGVKVSRRNPVRGKKAARKVARKATSKRGGGADSSVRSPTRTSTEVRSPTRTATSTWAKTSGNITVTGGAGAGATNVRIEARGSKANPQVGDYELSVMHIERQRDGGLFRWDSMKSNSGGVFRLDKRLGGGATLHVSADSRYKFSQPPPAVVIAAKRVLSGKAA